MLGATRHSLFVLAILTLAACADQDFYDTGVPVIGGGEGAEEAALAGLSAQEISIYLKNTTLSHRTEDRVWTVYVGEGGSLRGLVETRSGNSASARASGTWRVTPDGLFCREWTSGNWDPEDSGCAVVSRAGSVYTFTPEGTLEGESGRIYQRLREPGNTRGL